MTSKNVETFVKTEKRFLQGKFIKILDEKPVAVGKVKKRHFKI